MAVAHSASANAADLYLTDSPQELRSGSPLSHHTAFGSSSVIMDAEKGPYLVRHGRAADDDMLSYSTAAERSETV